MFKRLLASLVVLALSWAPSFAAQYEFQLPDIPTVQNASYSAGQALGKLQSISMGNPQVASGILTQLQIQSTGGSTTGIVLYVWSQNPTHTTCTDKTNFVSSQADNEWLVIPPTLVTPATVVSAQDTKTYASVTNLSGNFYNVLPDTTLYVCLVANASVTPATTTDLLLILQGMWDNAS